MRPSLPHGFRVPADDTSARESGVISGYAIGLATGLLFAVMAFAQGDAIGYERGNREGLDALTAHVAQAERCTLGRIPQHLLPQDRPGR